MRKLWITRLWLLLLMSSTSWCLSDESSVVLQALSFFYHFDQARYWEHQKGRDGHLTEQGSHEKQQMEQSILIPLQSERSHIWQLIEEKKFLEAREHMTQLSQTISSPFKGGVLSDLAHSVIDTLDPQKFYPQEIIKDRQLLRKKLESIKKHNSEELDILIIHAATIFHQQIISYLQDDLSFLGFKVSIADGHNPQSYLSFVAKNTDYVIVLPDAEFRSLAPFYRAVNDFLSNFNFYHPNKIFSFPLVSDPSLPFRSYQTVSMINFLNYSSTLLDCLHAIVKFKAKDLATIDPNQLPDLSESESDVLKLCRRYHVPVEESVISPEQAAIARLQQELNHAQGQVSALEARQDKAEQGDQSYDASCVICLDAERTTVFTPCGHAACCSNCATLVQTCPLCRQDIASKVRLIIP